MSFPDTPSGVAWYVGAPQRGKTTLALKHAEQLSVSTGKPCLTLDLGGARQFVDEYHEISLGDIADGLWTSGEHLYYTPDDVGDIDSLCKMLAKGRDFILVVDEAVHALNAKGAKSAELLKIMRTHSHARAHILLTTQHFSGDIPSEARSVDPHLYIFTVSKQALPTLELLEAYYGIERERVTSLPVGEFIEVAPGV